MNNNKILAPANALIRLVLALPCFTILSAHAQTTLNPTADAYVQGGSNASTNFGTNTQLRIQTNSSSSSNYDSYLKFDTTGQTFTVAKVRINASLSGSGSAGVALYAVATTTWTETAITWNNKPARGAQQATTVNVTSTTAAWIEFDVSSYVLAEKAAGRPVVSFALHAPSNVSVRVNASSREASSNKPQLQLTTSSNLPPTVSLTAPANNASFTAPATINLTATATDSDGTVSKVEFYQGATLIATDTTSPYAATWNNAPAGVYSLTAKATDNLNAVTTSTPVAITITPPVQAYYIHTDHLNTPRVISDQTQKTVWRWQNTEGFGNSLAEEDPDNDGITFTCNLRFPGQYYDKETATHYNYYRDYDPTMGRYVESDPIGLRGGINTYGYVGGNPVSFVDPMGLESQIVIWQPVGWGSSSFGHVSTNINGTTYSFGHGGMWTGPTSLYMIMNNFRSGVGTTLNLTSAQENQFEACMKQPQGNYSAVANNCGAPAQYCLQKQGINLGGYTPLPVNFGNNLINSGIGKNYSFYPASAPATATGSSAPWAR